jgi:peptidoglycan/xylan/chitin deacetylase (PgdA/CDA1 family)
MLKQKFRKVKWKVNSLASRILPRSMVLMYHRVVDLDSDPQQLSVTPDNFEMQMDAISRNFHPISLKELVNDLASGEIRDRTCVITIDDGYEDNYLHAKPVLEKFGIPATIFVSSGYTGTRREFWWDELDWLILQNQSLPNVVHISVNGTEHCWPVSEQEHDTRWRAPPTRTATAENRDCFARHEIYMDLCQLLKPMKFEQLNDTLAQLRDVTGDSRDARQRYIAMNAEQIRSLHQGGLIEIGSHTQSHINLATQPVVTQKMEIEGSKSDLETMVGSEVESFAYPFGGLRYYSSQSIKCVKNAGFSSAVSGYGGNVTRLTSVYEIPRRIVRDWDAETFEKKLEQYYSGQA